MKKLTVLVAIACLYPVSGFTFPVVQSVLKRLNVTPRVSKDAGCTDFTGNWKGSCAGANGERQDSVTKIVQQGCAFLVSDDQFIPLGGFTSGNVVTPHSTPPTRWAEILSNTSGWNANKTAVKMNFSGSAQLIGQEELIQINGDALLHIEGLTALARWFGRWRSAKIASTIKSDGIKTDSFIVRHETALDSGAVSLLTNQHSLKHSLGNKKSSHHSPTRWRNLFSFFR